MASLYDDTMIDFDLNFLQPTTSNESVVKHEKQRQSVLNVKKKIIASSALLKKYYTQKERLEETECLLLAAKEECKQTCIDNKFNLEKYTELEKNAAMLKERNQQLLKSVENLQNEAEAMKSHAYQLQTLVKEKESMMEAFKIEKELEKNSSKDYEKKLKSFEKERESFLNDIRLFKDVVLGKKKVKEIKHILTKYKDMKIFDDCIESDNSDLDDFEDSPIRSPSPIDNIRKSLEKEHFFIKKDNKEACNDKSSKLKNEKFTDDHDSDYGNEVVSEDTGRGSSLAMSEINSPQNNFITGDFNIITKEPIVQVDVATSPMREEHNVLVNIGTSPMRSDEESRVSSPNIYDDVALLSDKNTISKTPEYFISDIPFSTEVVTIKEKPQLVDAGTNTIEVTHNITHRGSSPIIFEHAKQDLPILDKPTEVCKPKQAITDTVHTTVDNDKCQMSMNNLSSDCEFEIPRKPIEDNESMKVSKDRETDDEIRNDREIQMILNEMTLYDMITPLPKRPKGDLHKTKETHGVCSEALKIREENKSLKSNVDFLCKEIMLIKTMLANKSYVIESDNMKAMVSSVTDSQDVFDAENEHGHITEEDENVPIESNSLCEDSTDLGSFTVDNDSNPIYLSPTETFDKSQNYILFEDDNSETISEVDKSCPNTMTDGRHNGINKTTDNCSSIKNRSVNKRLKRRKQTKLDLLKRNIIPRGKISAQLPNRKRRKIPLKPIVRTDSKNKLLDIINNQDAYDKARKVMVEMKSKEQSEPKFIKRIVKIKKCNKNGMRNISDRSVKVAKETEKEKALSDPEQIEHQIISPKKNIDVVSTLITSPDTKIDDGFSTSQKTRNISKDLEEKQHNIENNTRSVNVDNDIGSINVETTPKSNRRRKRNDSDSSNVSYKRMLRSSNFEKSKSKETTESNENRVIEDYNDLNMFDTTENVEKENIEESCLDKTTDRETSLCSKVKSGRMSSNSESPKRLLRSSNTHISNSNKDTYGSSEKIDKSAVETIQIQKSTEVNIANTRSGYSNNPGNSILCKMINKYGKNVIKTSASKLPDNVIDPIFTRIDTTLSDIDKPTEELQKALDDLTQYLKRLKRKELMSGLMKFLQDPARKLELYNKASTKVPMTKKEQMIVYIIKQMKGDILYEVLRNIDYTLFCLSKNPEFDTVESLSHLFAVLCRIFNLKSRLKVFMLDAMYCLNFKAIVVVKQCLVTWPHVLPLAQLSHAKSPLVLSIVYLLHFLKCDNRGMKRATDIRWLLDKKYMFNFNDWNQNRVLEMFSKAIKTIRDDPTEKNMLRMAIIIFAKRQGVKWCQKHIINNLLLPTIENENTPERVKVFCIKILGPLFKVYPVNMKVHCEIMTNRLLDMLEQENLSHTITEGIFTSLVVMSKHNLQRVNTALLNWRPDTVSAEFEALMKSYVRERPIKAWKNILFKTNFV